MAPLGIFFCKLPNLGPGKPGRLLEIQQSAGLCFQDESQLSSQNSSSPWGEGSCPQPYLACRSANDCSENFLWSTAFSISCGQPERRGKEGRREEESRSGRKINRNISPYFHLKREEGRQRKRRQVKKWCKI